jgi:hypothetical protein
MSAAIRWKRPAKVDPKRARAEILKRLSKATNVEIAAMVRALRFAYEDLDVLEASESEERAGAALLFTLQALKEGRR